MRAALAQRQATSCQTWAMTPALGGNWSGKARLQLLQVTSEAEACAIYVCAARLKNQNLTMFSGVLLKSFAIEKTVGFDNKIGQIGLGF